MRCGALENQVWAKYHLRVVIVIRTGRCWTPSVRIEQASDIDCKSFENRSSPLTMMTMAFGAHGAVKVSCRWQMVDRSAAALRAITVAKSLKQTLREVLGLAENHLRLTRDDGGLDAEVASRLQKAHRRVARDLAAVECAHIIGWNAHFKKAQLDGVGNLSKDMLQMGEWLVEPEENKRPLRCRILHQLKSILCEALPTWESCRDDSGRSKVARGTPLLG